jgi:hypothetical protein
VHGVYLLLNRLVSLDIDLFVWIIVLPLQVWDPSLLFSDKNNEKTLSESMIEKFHTHIGVCGLDVESICDPTMRFVTQVLACKLLRKCQKDQVLVTVIVVDENYVKGMQMKWKTFLLNQFLIDCEEEQDKGIEFRYAWLLILITLTTWRDWDDSQFWGEKYKA